MRAMSLSIERRKAIEAQIKDAMQGLAEPDLPLAGITQEELDLLREDWETEACKAVYNAALILEKAEHAGLMWGNGHHAAQEVAEVAVKRLRKDWRPKAPAGSGDNDAEKAMTAQ